MKMRPCAASLESTGSPVRRENVVPSGRRTVTVMESRPSYHSVNSMKSFWSPVAGVYGGTVSPICAVSPTAASVRVACTRKNGVLPVVAVGLLPSFPAAITTM